MSDYTTCNPFALGQFLFILVDKLMAVHAIYRLVGVTLMQEKRIFHAHFPVDRELQGHVLVYTRSAKTSKLS